MKLKNFKYFYPEKPQLILKDSNVFNQLSRDKNYICEYKFNGARCIIHVLNGKVEFWDRHGKHLSYNNNPNENIIDFFKTNFSKGYYVFDCELRHNKVVDIKNKLAVFDCFIFNNELLKLPYWGRRTLIKDYFSDNMDDIIHLTNQFNKNFKNIFDSIKSNELEGIVIKNLQGKLNLGRMSGQNSLWMFKVRNQTGRYRY